MAKKQLTPEEKAIRNKKRLENYNPIMSSRNALRREFSRSPIVQELMRENKRHVPKYKKNGERAKVDAVEHFCNVCKQWKKGNFAADHIDPVVDPDIGFVDFNAYFERMFVDKAKLQCCCKACHTIKTNAERLPRRLTEYRSTLAELELIDDMSILKKKLKAFNKKRLSECSDDIIELVNSLKKKC